MKITATTTEEGFKPVKVEILLESQDEVNLLYRISGYNVSIPDFIASKGDKTPGIKNFAEVILTAINNRLEKHAYE